MASPQSDRALCFTRYPLKTVAFPFMEEVSQAMSMFDLKMCGRKVLVPRRWPLINVTDSKEAQ